MRKKNTSEKDKNCSSGIPAGNNLDANNPEQVSSPRAPGGDPDQTVTALNEQVRADSTQSRLMSLIEVTPALMSRVTGYSESTCKKVLYDVYPNKEITEFINQQTSIFLKRVRRALYNVELYNAIDNAMVGRKIKDPEQMRLFVELQNLNQLLNGGV